MADEPMMDEALETEGDAPPSAPTPRRGPGHRGADQRDTAAEMAARAHEISLEAGSRMAGVMRSVVGAAAGLAPFAVDSCRELIQYMVRRGQMGVDEAELLVQQTEAAYVAKFGALPKPEPKAPPPKPVPLGQLPKAVTAPAAAAEAALQARAAMRIEPQKPSDRVTFAPLPPKPAPKAPVAKAAAAGSDDVAPPTAEPVAKAAAKPAAKSPAKAPATSPAKDSGSGDGGTQPSNDTKASTTKAPTAIAPARTVAWLRPDTAASTGTTSSQGKTGDATPPVIHATMVTNPQRQNAEAACPSSSGHPWRTASPMNRGAQSSMKAQVTAKSAGPKRNQYSGHARTPRAPARRWAETKLACRSRGV